MKPNYFIRAMRWLLFLVLVVCGPVGWIVAYLLWKQWYQTPVPVPPPEIHTHSKTNSKSKKKAAKKRAKKNKRR